MNYKHSNSSKPIPGIFNKIEKPILLQSNCLKNRNLKHLLQILSKLSCIELAMAKKLSWLIPILKKLTPIFLKFPMYLRKTAKFRYEEANLLFEQKKYGEATEIISDVFKILIPNYSNRANILQLKILYAETILLDALDCRQLFF
jgi:hypothetical protein